MITAHTQQSSTATPGLSLPSRRQRVAILVIVAVLLSVVDLFATLACIHGQGMFEMNPVVVWIVNCTDSTLGVVALKLASVGFGLGILYRLRATWQAEVASWLAAAGLCVLAGAWGAYAHAMHDVSSDDLQHLAATDSGWLQLNDVPPSPPMRPHVLQAPVKPAGWQAMSGSDDQGGALSARLAL